MALTAKDVAYNRRVRRLAPAAQEALARQFYERIWPVMAPHLGAGGQPSPLVVFDTSTNAPGSNRVEADGSGIRRVVLNGITVKSMIYRGDSSLVAEGVLAHEWRHIFQNADLYSVGRDLPHDQQPIEADAINFATRVVADIKMRERRMRRGKPLPPALGVINPGAEGPNVGANPRTLPFPAGGSVSAPHAEPLDRRATRMNTAALERVVRNGNADPSLRTAAAQVLRQRRAHPRQHSPEPKRK